MLERARLTNGARGRNPGAWRRSAMFVPRSLGVREAVIREPGAGDDLEGFVGVRW